MNSNYDKSNINLCLRNNSFFTSHWTKIPKLKSTIKDSNSRKKLTNFSRAEING